MARNDNDRLVSNPSARPVRGSPAPVGRWSQRGAPDDGRGGAEPRTGTRPPMASNDARVYRFTSPEARPRMADRNPAHDSDGCDFYWPTRFGAGAGRGCGLLPPDGGRVAGHHRHRPRDGSGRDRFVPSDRLRVVPRGRVVPSPRPGGARRCPRGSAPGHRLGTFGDRVPGPTGGTGGGRRVPPSVPGRGGRAGLGGFARGGELTPPPFRRGTRFRPRG